MESYKIIESETDEIEIVQENKFIINHTKNIIKIPLWNAWRKIVNYAISNKNKYELLSKHNFFLRKFKHTDKKYAATSKDRNIISMHEIIIGGKAEEGYKIDHRNGDGLDNREENLRYATNGENGHNRKKKEGTSSKYFGVSFMKMEIFCKTQRKILLFGRDRIMLEN